MRYGIGILLRRLSHLLTALIPAVLRPRDLLALTRDHYRRVCCQWTERDYVEAGLSPSESAAIDRNLPREGSALVLFCGGGRDAIALARRGLRVTATDCVPEMLECARQHSKELGLAIDCRLMDVLDLRFPRDSFDCVVGLLGMYGSVPGRRNRTRVLKQIHFMLRPGGVALLSVFFRRSSRAERRLFLLQRAVAILTMGNWELQPGDAFLNGVEFSHSFQDEEEVLTEFSESGFAQVSVEYDKYDTAVAVGRKSY